MIQRRAHVLVHGVAVLLEGPSHLSCLLCFLCPNLEVVVQHDAAHTACRVQLRCHLQQRVCRRAAPDQQPRAGALQLRAQARQALEQEAGAMRPDPRQVADLRHLGKVAAAAALVVHLRQIQDEHGGNHAACSGGRGGAGGGEGLVVVEPQVAPQPHQMGGRPRHPGAQRRQPPVPPRPRPAPQPAAGYIYYAAAKLQQ